MSGGEFRRVASLRLWSDGKMRALRRRNRDAHELVVYLVTCPHANLVGLFALSPAHAVADLCWTRSRFPKALAVLQAEGLAFYDGATEIVYTPLILDWQPISTQAQAEGAVRRLQALPPVPSLLDRLRQDLVARGQVEVSEKVRPLLEYLGLTPRQAPVQPTVTPPVRQGTPSHSPSPSHSHTQGPSHSPSPSHSSAQVGPEAHDGSGSPFQSSGRDRTDGHLEPPRTKAEEIFEDCIAPVTRELHRRDEWLRVLNSPTACAAAMIAAGETREAVRLGQARNPGAYLWRCFQNRLQHGNEDPSRDA